MPNNRDDLVPYDVRASRRELGLKVNDLAKLTDRTRVTVWRWETDRKCPQFVVTILKQQATIRALVSR